MIILWFWNLNRRSVDSKYLNDFLKSWDDLQILPTEPPTHITLHPLPPIVLTFPNIQIFERPPEHSFPTKTEPVSQKTVSPSISSLELCGDRLMVRTYPVYERLPTCELDRSVWNGPTRDNWGCQFFLPPPPKPNQRFYLCKPLEWKKKNCVKVRTTGPLPR